MRTASEGIARDNHVKSPTTTRWCSALLMATVKSRALCKLFSVEVRREGRRGVVAETGPGPFG